MAGRASAGCLVWVAKHPQLVLLDRGQKLVLLCSVVPVLNGASVKFSLTGQILIAAPSTLATATATAAGRTCASPSPQGGHLACFGRVGCLLRELEVHISFLHGGEGQITRGSGMDGRIHDLEQRVCHLQTMLHSMCNRDEQPSSNNSFRCMCPGLTNEDYARRYAGSPLSVSDRNYGEMENTQNLEELECIDGDQKQK